MPRQRRARIETDFASQLAGEPRSPGPDGVAVRLDRELIGAHAVRPHARRRGIGIAEVVVASAIVGLMMVAALNSVGMVFRTRKLNADRLIGPALAQSLMTEILSMPYKDPETSSSTIGVDTGESAASRATFDDVDDYHNWSAADAKAKDGTALAGYTGWSQQVTVTRANPITGGVWTGTDYGLKRITVTVTSPSARQTQIVALRSEDGLLEQPLAVSAEAVTWLGAELRTGASGKSQFVAGAVANHAADAN